MQRSNSWACEGVVDNSLAAERHRAHMEKTFPKAGNPRRSHLSHLSYGLFRVTCRLCPVTSSSISRCFFKTGAPKSPVLYILRLCSFHVHRVTCILSYVIGPVSYFVWFLAYVLFYRSCLVYCVVYGVCLGMFLSRILCGLWCMSGNGPVSYIV